MTEPSMAFNQIAVPVADAAHLARMAEGGEAGRRYRVGRHDQLLLALLGIWTLVHFSTFGFVQGLWLVVGLLALFRRLLWFAIAAGIMLLLARSKGALIARTVAPILPYFLCGMVAAAAGFDPHSAVEPLLIWLFGVLGAAAFGIGCSSPLLRRILFFFFLGIIVASALFVILRPDMGISADNRSEGGGAWNGLFSGKNFFGLICVYGMLFALLADRVGRLARWAAVVFCGMVLVFSHSQGAVAAGGAVVGFYFYAQFLHRANLSPGVRALVLVTTVLLTAAVLVLAFAFVSQLFGRDATLTGRTEIWGAWFNLALRHWLTGSGPGSFTTPSIVTAELTAAEARLGMIHTPHNMMIAVFGETGMFGLLAFMTPLLYFTFVLPFVRPSREASLVSMVAFTTLIGGITETREVFGTSMNMFLIVTTYANCVREEWLRRARSDRDDHLQPLGRALALGV